MIDSHLTILTCTRPDWLTSELLGMGKELSRTKRFRDAVLEFMAGQPPAMNLIPLGPVFQSALCAYDDETPGLGEIRL